MLARYCAKAEFIDKFPKPAIVDLLVNNPKGAELAPKVLQNMCHMHEIDSINVAIAMAEDLVQGMSEQEVIQKPYPCTIEKWFWTQKDYIPKQDPHWNAIDIIHSDIRLEDPE